MSKLRLRVVQDLLKISLEWSQDVSPGLFDPTVLVTTMYLLPKLRLVAYGVLMKISLQERLNNSIRETNDILEFCS